MKAAICALLFVVACKSESKPANKDEAPTPTESGTSQARPHPKLPEGGPMDDGRARPRLPDDTDGDGDSDQPRDWADPAQREEMRAMREQRRKEREAQLDTNKDGVLSAEEKAQRVAPMLKRMDANADGKLTPDEVASTNRRMGFDDPAALDTDKNGEISLIELEAAVTQRREKMREKWKGRGGRGFGPGSGAE